ncbi:MAG: hypothetical protein KY397_05775, partial [Gemmatimonadetes bacterium]|nr:hypothetical protein [Gemmatimonadota bacterium]
MATTLEFGQQPTDAEAGAAITPAVTVRAVVTAGVLDPTFEGDVTVAIGTGGGTLSGTKTVTAVDGVATFSDLSIDAAGEGYTLEASADGLTSATSAAFAITPADAS